MYSFTTSPTGGNWSTIWHHEISIPFLNLKTKAFYWTFIKNARIFPCFCPCLSAHNCFEKYQLNMGQNLLSRPSIAYVFVWINEKSKYDSTIPSRILILEPYTKYVFNLTEDIPSWSQFAHFKKPDLFQVFILPVEICAALNKLIYDYRQHQVSRASNRECKSKTKQEIIEWRFASYNLLESFASDKARTFTPFEMSSIDENSSGLWLYPEKRIE